jgi:ATP phosphoribosyltransferase regulatory subunit
MEDVVLCEEDEEKIRKFIENKNFAALKEFLSCKDDCLTANKIEILEKLPKLFGNIDVLNEAKKLTENENALKAIQNIEKLYEIIKLAGFEDYLTIDLGMVQHLNYYTGLIFKGYTSEVGDDILAGGRYDNLTAEFGNDKHSTGFAINIDSIMIALEKQNKLVKEHHKQYVIYAEKDKMKKAFEALEVMENDNKRAELSLFDSLEETKKYVEENNKTLMIIE